MLSSLKLVKALSKEVVQDAARSRESAASSRVCCNCLLGDFAGIGGGDGLSGTRTFAGDLRSNHSLDGRVPFLGGSGACRGCSPKPVTTSGESISSPAVNLNMLLDFFGGGGDTGGEPITGDETLILPLLLKMWCLGEVRESSRCKEPDLSDSALVALVSAPAAAAFRLFASSAAASSARDSCTGGGANMLINVVSLGN